MQTSCTGKGSESKEMMKDVEIKQTDEQLIIALPKISRHLMCDA